MDARVPQWSIELPMRCHSSIGSSSTDVCSLPARWMRNNANGSVASYFCNVHREPSDLELPASYVFRRLHIEAVLYVASASRLVDVGKLEAIARLDRAFESIGVVPDYREVRSTLGRFGPFPLPPSGGAFIPIAK